MYYCDNFVSAEDVRGSEKYAYFKELGFSDNEALVLSLINFSTDYKTEELLNAFKKQKEKKFIEFIADNYFSAEFDPEKETSRVSAQGGMPGFMEGNSWSGILYEDGSEDLEEDAVSAAAFVDDAEEVLYYSAPHPKNASPILSPMYGITAGTGLKTSSSISGLLEDIRTDSYEPISEKDARNVIDSPTATFRPTYNTASAGILLSNIRDGARIRNSMVRTEELLNYLHYDLNQPEHKKFEITKELKKEGDKTYLFLGVQGERAIPARQNICLLLDVSGSMSDNTDSIITSIMTVLAGMNPGDVFSLVTYSNKDRVIISGLILNENKNLDDIAELLFDINIDGWSNGSAGLNKAYEIVEKNMIRDGVNRVIIITDGDLNFGIHDKDGLKGLIEKKRESGAYFSAIGTGIYNLQDDKLEALAKNGNGNYFVVNDIRDVRKTIRNNYEALVYPIAKNVKAQVEFNPGKVKTWKLIGYENRMLNHEDFRNDKVIAEPFGSGSCFVALFELTMNDGESINTSLKYQKTEVVASDELGTLTVRYEDVIDGVVKEIGFAVEDDLPATGNIEKAIECASLAEKLRSDNIDELCRKKAEKLLSDQ